MEEIKKKILVIDDDRGMTLMVESLLKSSGFDVVVMNYPKHVVKTIKTECPDLILCDVIMPYQDGYKVCEEVKQSFSNKIPIILFTCQPYEREFIEEAYRDFGADDYLRKPFEKQELVEKIEKLIAKFPNPFKTENPVKSPTSDNTQAPSADTIKDA